MEKLQMSWEPTGLPQIQKMPFKKKKLIDLEPSTG